MCVQLLDNPSEALSLLLLTLWGVTPSSAYLHSLGQLLSSLKESFHLESFYSQFCSNASHLFSKSLILLSSLYLAESRDLKLQREEGSVERTDCLLWLLLLERRVDSLSRWLTSCENCTEDSLKQRLQRLILFFSGDDAK